MKVTIDGPQNIGKAKDASGREAVSSGRSRISRMGAPTPKGCLPIILAKFCQKLHDEKNEENWTGGVKIFTM